jgi:ferric-dicitrate binding protein FerR (iron transport regulator)
MRCKKARELISLYVAPDDSCLSPNDRQALEAHMAVCEQCRENCRESREVIAVLQKYWQISADTATLLEKGRQGSQHRISRIIKLHGVYRYVAVLAVAACLGIAVLIDLVFTNQKSETIGHNQAVALTGKDLPLIIESADGGHIAPGAMIQTSAGEIENLVINGRHRVVMNACTKLSIQSHWKADNAGCLMNLAFGEVYVHVEHDGHPFKVQTAHGRAVVTGTTFDVKATDTSTALVVVEGSVRFESEKDLVEVTSGQISKIIAHSAPTRPISCKSVELTA